MPEGENVSMTMASDMEIYRLEHEAFVSNQGGSTWQEVTLTLLPNVCGIFLTATTLGILKKYIYRDATVVLEFVMIVIPTILCCTVLSELEHIFGVCIIMMLVSALNMWLLGAFRDSINFYKLDVRPVTGKRPFITNFRALTNIITAICILAVDFRIFPRKFVKTERYGFSLMDTGVGLFILANALVAPEARDFSTFRQTGFQETLTKNIKKCIQSCLPLLVLGFGRFIAVELTGYQKHVTEYGVHWNFFITLAAVKLFASMITSTISSKYSLFSGAWILGMHEYIMTTKGLGQWVLGDAPRDDFFSANREGLVSIPGYVGLYFIGVAIGRLIHSTYQNTHTTKSNMKISVKLCGFKFESKYNESMLLCIKLYLITVLALFAFVLYTSHFTVSRRLANVGYCICILTLTITLLHFLLFVEILLDITNYAAINEPCSRNKIKKLSKNSRLNLKKNVENERKEITECVIKGSLEICDAVNYNGLFFFLLSNVLTGLVNMSICTIHVNHLLAIVILIIYMGVSIFCTLILYRLQIPVKL